MSRFVARTSQTAIDLALVALAYAFAYLLRFEWSMPAEMAQRFFVTLPYVVVLQYGALYAFSVPRFAWRYVGLREATRTLEALTLAAGVLLVFRVAAGTLQGRYAGAAHVVIPIGVILINYALSFLFVLGVRVLRRLTAERARQATHRASSDPAVPTLLVGAGQAGVMVVKEIEARPDLGLRAVGFVDDDTLKHNTVVHGVPVLGDTAAIESIARATGARQVLITIANAPGAAVRRIVGLCDAAGIPAKIIPAIHELVGGSVNLSRIRNVAIEDLLRRDPIVLDETAIQGVVHDRVVLVSGAGGSIGSELCRQVCRFKPARLVLVERAENNLFQIHRELVEKYPDLAVVPCIADVGDERRMEAVFAQHRPHAVFHAAAHKHVPMMEWNPGEAVKNNVVGTKVLADLAHAHGVREFVMISTDKAVNPTSVMGATKRVAELYIQSLARRSETRFVTVRFGNVLGSAGSVIPIFQEQIARGGPVTVTHPEMKRYFMTIPEACQLVLQAATMGNGGEIFVLDMGEPVKIVDLARDLIRLSGLVPDQDVEIVFTGMRPGEKLFEELTTDGENADKTRHPKIFIGRLAPQRFDLVAEQIAELARLAETTDELAIRDTIAAIVPEYAPPAAPSPRAAPRVSGVASTADVLDAGVLGVTTEAT